MYKETSRDIHGSDENENFSQYLSFRFYKENLENFKDKTRDSINIFLKTISEIEDEFIGILQTQQSKPTELDDFGFETTAAYMEENY